MFQYCGTGAGTEIFLKVPPLVGEVIIIQCIMLEYGTPSKAERRISLQSFFMSGGSMSSQLRYRSLAPLISHQQNFVNVGRTISFVASKLLLNKTCRLTVVKSRSPSSCRAGSMTRYFRPRRILILLLCDDAERMDKTVLVGNLQAI